MPRTHGKGFEAIRKELGASAHRLRTVAGGSSLLGELPAQLNEAGFGSVEVRCVASPTRLFAMRLIAEIVCE